MTEKALTCNSCRQRENWRNFLKEKENDLGSTKLTLCTRDLICVYNVVNSATPKCATCSDLANVLINILRKVFVLKITYSSDSLDNLRPLNVSIFGRVHSLELASLPVPLIGELFQTLGPQLNSLVCQRNGLTCLRNLLSGNADLVHPWKELRYIDVAFNDLSDLDDSLSLLPNLKLFNISHNKLKNLASVELLKEVEHLNLSYNHLCCIPRFSALSCTTLKKLALKGNLIENLNGLEYLAQLEELDLRWNILSTHSLLTPMKELSHLAKLDLEGNPLTFHKQHRPLTASHLDGPSLGRGIYLDGVILSERDIKKASTIIVPMEATTQNGNSTFDSSFSVSFGSSFGNGRQATAKKKIRKMREVTIIDPDEPFVAQESLPIPQIAQDIEDHLQTKKILEDKRKMLGSGWLVSTSTPPNSYVPENQHFTSESPIIEVAINNPISLNDDGAHSEEDEVEVLEQTTPRSEDSLSVPTSPPVDLYDTNPISPDSQEDLLPYEGFDDEDTGFDGDLFLVQSNGKDIFIGVGTDKLGERDAFTTKLLNTLDLRALVAARKLAVPAEEGMFAIRLVFDTLRKENQERTYKMESEDTCQAFLGLMRKIISERPVTLMLQCLKCSAEFSEKLAEYATIDPFTAKNNEVGSLPTGKAKEVRICPKCRSTMLVESNSGPSDSSRNASTLQSAFFSTVSEHTKPAKLDTASVKALGSSVAESRLEDDLERKHGIERSESDITVLSNPSQSSIALVSDHGSCWEGQESDYHKLMPALTTCYEQDDDTSSSDQASSSDCTRSGVFSGRGSSHFSIGIRDSGPPTSGRFTRLDHQIKLYLEMEVFSEHEEVEAVLESWVVARRNVGEQLGLFLATDKNVYLFSYADSKSSNPSNGDVWRQLHKEHSCPIKSLQCICVFPGNQGFCVCADGNSKQFAVLTRDANVCRDFLCHLREVLQLSQDIFLAHIIKEELKQVLQKNLEEKEEQVDEGWLLLFLMIGWNNCETNLQDLHPAAIAITREHLSVLYVDYFAKNSPLSFTSVDAQPISNLTSLHIGEDPTKIGLHFLDEVLHREKSWLLQVYDKSLISDLLCALKDPWEEIFGIDLRPSVMARCSCGVSRQ